MADNVTANAGSGGSIFAAASLSFSGDTALVPLGSPGLLTGSEGAWTYTLCVGGAGAVTAGTQRTTLASDDPAVASLSAINAKITAVNTGAVVVSSSALPSGAATAAKQPALGTAGTASADVVTVQGIASGVTIPVSIAGTVTVASHAVTNAGTFAVQVDGAALTSLQLIDDAISGAGFNQSQMGGVNVAMNTGVRSTGTQRVTIATDDIVPASQSGTWTVGISASQTIAVTNAGTFATQATLQTGSNAIGKLAANSGVTIGAVEIASAQTLATVTTVTTCSTVTTLTGGGVAHDGVDSGNPIKTGARAVSTLATVTLVAAADRTDDLSGTDGVPIVRIGAPLGDILSDRITDTAGTSVASAVFTSVASTRNVITGIVVYNSSASAGYIDFRDGTGGSVLWTLPLPAGGGAVLPAGAMPYFRTAANTALAYDVSAALSTVYVSVSGYQSKVA